jgi:flagellar FliL protein
MASKPKNAELEEVEADDADGSATPPKGGLFSRRNIIIAAASAVVLIGGGTGTYFMMKKPSEAEPTAAQVKPPVFVDVPEVLVNLSTTANERTQYLKVKIVLELADDKLAPQVKSTMPRVMDAFQTYLRELRPSDLDGSAGLYRLKEELTRRVNVAIAPSRINAVLFKEIVVQ